MGLETIGRSSLYGNCGYWAPVVRMYYCVVVNNGIKTGGTAFDGSWTERAFIGMAETTSPETGNWTDYGFVTCSSSDKGKDGWADNVTALTARFGTRIGARSTSRWQASEAPEIVYKDGYFYLFMAYDGLDVPYNTRVVRSDKIEGPYLDITGRNFTNARGDCYPIVTHPYKFSKGPG